MGVGLGMGMDIPSFIGTGIGNEKYLIYRYGIGIGMLRLYR